MQVFRNGENDKKKKEEEAVEKINPRSADVASVNKPNLGERIATGIASVVKRTFGTTS